MSDVTLAVPIAVQAPPPPPSSGTLLVSIVPGFDTKFRVTPSPGYAPNAIERDFMACVNGCVDAVWDGKVFKRGGDGGWLLADATKARDGGVRRLRAQADAVVALPPGTARDAEAQCRMAECWRTEGRYTEFLRRIDSVPFIVGASPNPDSPKLMADVTITVLDVPITPEQAALKTELDGAVTVTRAVLLERERAAGGLLPSVLGIGARQVAAVRQVLNDYIVQLAGIGDVGLAHLDASQAGFARADLARFKAEFTMREAGIVKNRYLHRLGWACAPCALVATAVFLVLRNNSEWTLAYNLRNFWLLAAGTCIGTWLSFSLRREVLSFEDLAVLEQDRLDPLLRVFFMLGLVLVVGLLFWTGAVSFGIGRLDSVPAIRTYGSGALLLGLLAGIAERALGTAISRRAGDFASALGSSTPAVAAKAVQTKA